MSSEPLSLGFSGRFAQLFIASKVTPVIIIVSLALGLFALYTTAKEEDPSVTVTVADVFLAFPGRGATEVDERIARPVAAWILEIPTVEHVVSSATDNGAMVVVEFHEGIEREQALTQLYERLNANRELLPPGVSSPLVTPRGVADAPILVATLWHEEDDVLLLRRLAAEFASELERLPQVSRVQLIGGARREIVVEIDAQRLAEHGLAADQVLEAVSAGNVRLPAGELAGPDGSFRVEAGALLTSAHDVAAVVVGVTSVGPVYLRDVASVRDGVAEQRSYVSHLQRDDGWAAHGAVTLAIHKINGSDAAEITKRARHLLERLESDLLPRDVHLRITRDTGRTATHRVITLIEHMLLATVIVVLLIGLALGWREALIVAIVIPVTLALVPFVYQLAGFTLNRITLSAMIFAIGILVDDAIVIIENIHRHFQQHRGQDDALRVTLKSVEEVGNPTILATLIIVAALLPTAFISGMLGQFVRALPIGASVAMLYSLFIALAVTPYLACRILKHPDPESDAPEGAGRLDHGWYRSCLVWLLAKNRRMIGAEVLAVLMFFGALSLVAGRVATVKIMPPPDVDEMSVMIDLAPASTLEETQGRVADVARRLQEIPEISSSQAYVGTPGPLTFQGVARHYMLRHEPYQAELQIELTPTTQRSKNSHRLADEVRRVVSESLPDEEAWFTVSEFPPGPPVQATLLAEVYGPNARSRIDLASRVKDLFEKEPGVVDVDWSARRGPPVLRYEIDQQRAAVRGVSPSHVATTIRTLVAGDNSVWAHLPKEREAVSVGIRLARSQRASETDLESLYFTSMTGQSVPATDIGRVLRLEGSYPLLRKDLQPYIWVGAEVTGPGPVYNAFDLSSRLREELEPTDRELQVLWTDAVPEIDQDAIRWGGEWTLTYELLRDLGVAFVVVLLLIYVALVAWYGSFLTPWVVMLPIPLALTGVIPAHPILGISIDGVGVVGLIALAGLMVRNSILLVDLAEDCVASGMDVRDAVLIAGEKRLLPILLTMLTVVLGDGVLFFDPMMQGLGLTLAAGAFFSTGLTLGLVPIAYFQMISIRQGRIGTSRVDSRSS